MGAIAFVITFCLLVGAFIFLGKGKRIINPLFLFLVIWSVVLLFSILQLYNIDPASNEAYLALLTMILSFTLGYVLYEVYRRKISKKKALMKKEEVKQDIEEKQLGFKSLRVKIYLIMCILLIIFNIIDCILVIKYISEGTPAWQVRNWSLEPFGSSNPILDRRSFFENVLRNIILAPMATLVPPITAYFMFKAKDKRFRITCFVISVLVLLTSSFAGGGGRFGFIYYAGCFGLAFLTLRTQDLKKKKVVSKRIIALVAVAISMVVGFTTLRTGIGNVTKQTYTYFAVPPTLLTKWMPKIEDSQKTYGMTTFFGAHSYVFRTLKTMGAEQAVPELYEESFNHILDAEKFQKVGYGVANAFVTPAYYFMIDGGYPFLCIVSLLFGLLCAFVFWKFMNRKSALIFVIYILMMYGVLLSFSRIQTTSPAYILAFIYAWLLFYEFKFLKKDKNAQIRK